MATPHANALGARTGASSPRTSASVGVCDESKGECELIHVLPRKSEPSVVNRWRVRLDGAVSDRGDLSRIRSGRSARRPVGLPDLREGALDRCSSTSSAPMGPRNV